VDPYLAAMEAAVADADAVLTTDLGGERIDTKVRLWRNQALVDWEPDPTVGDCLFRPVLLRRLLELHATWRPSGDGVVVEAPGRVVASLSPEHTALVQQMGGARRVQLTLRLAFPGGVYRGGTETFEVVERGRRVPLMRLTATLEARTVSPRTSPLPR
jgi:hypothetical protein